MSSQEDSLTNKTSQNFDKAKELINDNIIITKEKKGKLSLYPK